MQKNKNMKCSYDDLCKAIAIIYTKTLYGHREDYYDDEFEDHYLCNNHIEDYHKDLEEFTKEHDSVSPICLKR